MTYYEPNLLLLVAACCCEIMVFTKKQKRMGEKNSCGGETALENRRYFSRIFSTFQEHVFQRKFQSENTSEKVHHLCWLLQNQGFHMSFQKSICTETKKWILITLAIIFSVFFNEFKTIMNSSFYVHTVAYTERLSEINSSHQ